MFVGQGQDPQPKQPLFPSQTTWLGPYLSSTSLPAPSTRGAAAYFLRHSAGTETRSPISRPPPIHSYGTQPRDSAQVQAKLHAILIVQGISQRRHFEPATHHFDSVGNQMERESKGNIRSHASHVHRIKSCIITELDNLFPSVTQ